MMNKPTTIIFTQDSPFFEMVAAFLAATMGLRPVSKREALFFQVPTRAPGIAARSGSA